MHRVDELALAAKRMLGCACRSAGVGCRMRASLWAMLPKVCRLLPIESVCACLLLCNSRQGLGLPSAAVHELVVSQWASGVLTAGKKVMLLEEKRSIGRQRAASCIVVFLLHRVEVYLLA